MLDLRSVLENLDAVRAALTRRGGAHAQALEPLVALGDKRKALIVELELLQRERNEASQAMGQIADKKSEAFAQKRAALRELSERIKGLQAGQRTLEAELSEALMAIPNLPAESVPDGASEDDNRLVKVWGDKPVLDFAVKDHVALGEGLGILDMERAAKISGARFAVLTGGGARLERALMAFMLDLHTSEHGYREVWPPALVKADSLRGTGQLPKFADDAFAISHDFEEGDNRGLALYLSPTAEVQLTNMHRDEILAAEQLPVRYTAYTPCFRAEAGSHGRDTRGLIRLHQFDKVELVQFVEPDQAEAALTELTRHAEIILERLELHYRRVELCAGDLGFSARRTFDLEVWLPAQEAYREISSCSWFGDYQARRAKVRYRAGKKPQLVHTLNGSGLAVGRTLVALLEQYQQADGSVVIPSALRPYMGGMDALRPEADASRPG